MLGENSADDSAFLKVIQKCMHCGEDTNKGNKYCTNCTKADDRRSMCKENQIINPNWHCRTCKI